MSKIKMQDNLKKIQACFLIGQQKLKKILSKVQEQFGQNQSVIGIDVGTKSIKVVQLADVDGKKVLVKSAIVDIGGRPGNQEEVLASLKTALIGFETKGAKIIAIINCPQTCTRKIITPQMPKKELAQAIRWEAKNAIPFSIDEALMDFEVLDEITEKDVKKLVVAVAATPKETVNKLLSLFSKGGIEISALIPISLSLQNFIATSKERQELNIAIVEMGASTTELNIYQKGRLAFSRKLPIAGDDITKAMTSTLMSSQGKVELTMEEAEKIKKEQGISSGDDTEEIDGKILPSQILSLVRPCVEQLASEIERSFDFFREESHGEQVNKIILFGGGAKLKGLVSLLNNELGLTVEMGDTFDGINSLSEKESDGGNEGIRFDLAVGAVFTQSDKINLLPVELKEKAKRFIEHISIQVVVVGVIMTLLLSTIGLYIQLGAQHLKMDALKLEQKSLVPQLETIRSKMVTNQILNIHPYWEDILREISNTIEPGMYLTELSMQDDIVNLKGIIFKSDQGEQAILSNFMITLEDGIFQRVSLVISKKEAENSTVSEFEITAEVE